MKALRDLLDQQRRAQSAHDFDVQEVERLNGLLAAAASRAIDSGDELERARAAVRNHQREVIS